ncbi:ferritin-like domain-containing protein [Natronoglomus mannanivorans]|uniref:Ferritin-like domain-containing protein n=1 Tax=Natronoglomus mannanivorans TaxID=2979990 RepID=A0AAP2Z3V9_9EURY|nr:ferritin-like domain-containing protein [Halobacteria archaeon AArc-xg1-1]
MTFQNNDRNTNPESTHERPTSRRRILAASAVIGAATVGGAPFVSADEDNDYDHEEDEDHDKDADETPQPPQAVPNEFESDVDILNFARTLEFLEAAFYQQGIENIGDDAFRQHFEGWGPLQDQVSDRLRVIRNHEVVHAEVLGATVETLGGEPVASPQFDFGTAVEDPAEFVATGALLEDVGVSAYAGAATAIENPDIVAPALSIHSVEARHASLLRELNGEIGFPVAFDQPRSRSEVLDLASGFIVD